MSDCNASELLDSGRQYSGIGKSENLAIQNELLYRISASSDSPQSILNAANSGLTKEQLNAVKTELLCRLTT